MGGTAGSPKAELLREALRCHLLRLASEVDAEIWEREPLTPSEASPAEIASGAPGRLGQLGQCNEVTCGSLPRQAATDPCWS